MGSLTVYGEEDVTPWKGAWTNSVLPRLTFSCMITDPRVFQDEYLPRELKHREGPVEELCRAFDPAVDGDQASDEIVESDSAAPQVSGQSRMHNSSTFGTTGPSLHIAAYDL